MPGDPLRAKVCLLGYLEDCRLESQTRNVYFMENFALFANAQYLSKTATAVLTVSDMLPRQEKNSADQREKALIPMIELAMAAAAKL